MKVFATAFLLFYLRISNAHNCSLENPCPYGFDEGRPFEQPEQLRSNSSSWEIDLHVNITKVEYGWLPLYRRTYNRKIVGPTWHIKRGDNITVRLYNHLSEDGNIIVPDENLFKFPNSTNLHTHGLHISGKDPQDNVLVKVEPGGNWTYSYQINPEQASGTNWYHAHLHGSTAFQVHSGLSGILIVDDDDSQSPIELSAVSCPNHCDKDIQMIFQPILEFGGFSGFVGLQSSIKDYEGFRFDGIMLNDGSGTNLSQWLQDKVNLHTTNGLLKPVLSMTTGQMYRFRMINAGGGTSFAINVTDENGTQSADCDYREIAVDGIYLDEPREPHLGRSFLTPGQRCDWMIKCNKPGTYKLKSWELEEDTLSTGLNGSLVNYGGVLVTLNVSGSVSNTTNEFPNQLPNRPSYIKDLRNITEKNISNRFVLEFEGVKLNNKRWVKNKIIGHKMKVNAVQEWNILNSSPHFTHPLHIHVNHFQVIGYNNYTGGVNVGNFTVTQKNSLDNLDEPCNYRGTSDGNIARDTSVDLLKYLGHDTRYKENGKDTIGYARIGDFRDTILVPPLANITIRFTTDLYTGNVIFHCHLLKHEDKGMMMLAIIVPENESISLEQQTDGYLPGVCHKCDRFPPNNKTRLCDKSEPSSSSSVSFSFMIMLLSIYAGFGCNFSRRR